MSGTLNQLLPEDDFWRTATFCVFLVFLVPLVAITGALAPEALVLGVFLAFVAWVVGQWSDSADETAQIEDEQELDALETLRKRYANGDIGEAEFEQRLDRLIETESPVPREKELSFE
ncbi:SHOCT domain-containing protein [Haladaptatus cibarius]|uniref:SHOCT domain-containing protein n=1 Tax=Haladaptatus cibarius TaxID=453847 RepID=UPI0006792404|nr:SHOCT domain-containing protein [Haladaptatus cibarius]